MNATICVLRPSERLAASAPLREPHGTIPFPCAASGAQGKGMTRKLAHSHVPKPRRFRTPPLDKRSQFLYAARSTQNRMPKSCMNPCGPTCDGWSKSAMNIIEQIDKEQIERLGKTIPQFDAGDTVIVNVRVKEGERSRIQAYEGVCIARNGGGINQSFNVRKISYGEGVERVFPLYSPLIESITVVRRGKVRRAKLYYLRDRRGKSARIAEKVDKNRVTKKDRREAAAAAAAAESSAPAAE